MVARILALWNRGTGRRWSAEIRYMARPAISLERLPQRADGMNGCALRRWNERDVERLFRISLALRIVARYIIGDALVHKSDAREFLRCNCEI